MDGKYLKKKNITVELLLNTGKRTLTPKRQLKKNLKKDESCVVFTPQKTAL